MNATNQFDKEWESIDNERKHGRNIAITKQEWEYFSKYYTGAHLLYLSQYEARIVINLTEPLYVTVIGSDMKYRYTQLSIVLTSEQTEDYEDPEPYLRIKLVPGLVPDRWQCPQIPVSIGNLVLSHDVEYSETTEQSMIRGSYVIGVGYPASEYLTPIRNKYLVLLFTMLDKVFAPELE